MKGNFGGFEHSAEADINELRQKLKGYGSQEAFLKEILQNTDDAGATLQRIGWIPGRGQADHPLLKGPALALINNKPLTPDEVHAIKRMGLGTKGSKQHAIGKFGQGIKTIFQVCEAFFFLARDPESEGSEEGPNVRELCNPWFRWHHSEWDRFEDGETKEILRRTSDLLPEGPWFLLYLPLRRKEHLESGERRVQPIVESHPGDEMSCPPSFRERLVQDLPSYLPMLKSIATVEFYENCDGKSKGPDLAFAFAAGSQRCSFEPETRKDSDLRGAVVISGAAEESVSFTGTTRWVQSPTLDSLSTDPLRPRIVETGADGAMLEAHEKAYPHAGIVVTKRIAGASDDRGQIELRWAVFLPVSGVSLDLVGWPTKLDLKIFLHGYFFLDPTRTRVDGQDGAAPFPEVAVQDEQSFCKQWNQVLARQGTLPLLPESLQRVSREILHSDLVQTTQLTKAIETTSVFRQFRQAIVNTHHWALIVAGGAVKWEALNIKNKPVLPLPEPSGSENAIILQALPGLTTRATLDGAIPVVCQAEGLSGGHVSWLGNCAPADWSENALAEAFDGVTIDTFERNEIARRYVLQFLTARNHTERIGLFEGILAEVCLFPVEKLGGPGRSLLSAKEVNGFLEASILIATASNPELARESADILGRPWWRLTDSAMITLLPAFQKAPHLTQRVVAQLILEREPSGSVRMRHALVKRFVLEGNWLDDNAVERRAARYLLHQTADRAAHNATLYLQGPETPVEWLEVARYVLEESAEDWRLLDEWIDLTFEQRRSLGVEILGQDSAVSILRELGPTTNFADLPKERRQFLMEKCEPDLIRLLKIHELITGALTAATGQTYLDADFVFLDLEEKELWKELSSRSSIIVRQKDRIQVARQLDVFEDRVVDAEGIINMAIDLGGEARRFWRLILFCLGRLGTPKATTGDRLTAPNLRWLPLKSGGFIALPDVVSVPHADEIIHGLLGAKVDGIVSVLALDERVRVHSAFPSLNRILLRNPAVLPNLALALQMRGDCTTALKSVESLVELNQWLQALEGFDDPRYPLLPLLKAICKDQTVAERFLSHLNAELAGAINIDATFALLEMLASRSEGDRHGQHLIRLHRKALECAVAAEQWRELRAKDMRLLNRDGTWKHVSKLVHAFEGVRSDFLVQESLGNFLASKQEEATEIDREGSTRKESITEYAKALARRVPKEIVGLFVAMLGGTAANQKLARAYLHGIGIRELVGKVIPADITVDGRNVLEAWERIQFFPEVLTGKSIVATSLAGTQLEIPIAENPATLIFGEFILQATATLKGDGHHINHRLQLLDLDLFPESNSEEDWVERVIRTLEMLLRSRFGQEDMSGLHLVARQISEMRGRWDIRLAQRLVIKSGDQLIQTLGVHHHPALRALFDDWQNSKQIEVQAEAFGEEDRLMDKAKALTKSAEAGFRNLLSQSPEGQKVFRDAMRKKITGFQYFPDSVLFELFQNADDAYVEQSSIAESTSGDETATFKLVVIERIIRVIHHGRPINQPNAEEHGRDLQKMLLLNASDKDVQLPNGCARTGHFGLGFKSVHLISDEPAVVSGELAFIVSGGLYPQRLEDADLLSQLRAYEPIGHVPATVFQLPLTFGISESDVIDRFVRLRSLLPVFGRKVRRVSIDGHRSFEAHWSPRPSAIFNGAEIGTVADIVGHLIALRSRVLEHGEVCVVFLVNASGFQRLPPELPALWATAPLDVGGEMCLAINGSFEIDAGRRQLAATSEKNRTIQLAGCNILGLWLVALAQRCRTDWEAVREELGLSPELSTAGFWTSFWTCLPQPQHGGESTAHSVVKTVLFHGETSGCGRALLEEPVLPTRLGNVERLVSWADVTHMVTGILAECRDIFDSLWPPDLLTKAMSDRHVIRRLKDWFPTLATDHLQRTSLRDLLLTNSESAEHFHFSPAEAARFGPILSQDRIEQLEDEDAELFLEEWEPLANELEEARFKTVAGTYRVASEIMVAGGSSEERLRCGFASTDAILSTDYAGDAVRFFLICRGDLKPHTERLVDWARDAIGGPLGQVLHFLLTGDARVRDTMVRNLGSAWIQRVETSPEFLGLPAGDQRRLLLWFGHRVEIQLPVVVQDDEIIRTTPELLLAWWEAHAQDAPTIQLTGDWGGLLFGDLLNEVTEESVAEALRHPGEEGEPVVGDHVWFRTLCICSFLATRTPREVARRFFEELYVSGFFRRVQPATATADDHLFEQELRRILDEILQRPLEGEHGGGESAELWRRVFYDARKMYRLVYLNAFPATLLQVIAASTEPRGPFRFLRSGELANQQRWLGVVGQSFKSPLFLLLRELRRLRVIEANTFDATCFYVCAPVRRAAARLDIHGDLARAGQDLDVDQHIQWSEALHAWVMNSTVSEAYVTRYFDFPFYALDELNGYNAIRLP